MVCIALVEQLSCAPVLDDDSHSTLQPFVHELFPSSNRAGDFLLRGRLILLMIILVITMMMNDSEISKLALVHDMHDS